MTLTEEEELGSYHSSYSEEIRKLIVAQTSGCTACRPGLEEILTIYTTTDTDGNDSNSYVRECKMPPTKPNPATYGEACGWSMIYDRTGTCVPCSTIMTGCAMCLSKD